MLLNSKIWEKGACGNDIMYLADQVGDIKVLYTILLFKM